MKVDFNNWVQDFIARDNVTIKEQDERGESEKAATDAKMEVAKNLKAMGLSNSDIKKATGLTEDAINAL